MIKSTKIQFNSLDLCSTFMQYFERTFWDIATIFHCQKKKSQKKIPESFKISLSCIREFFSTIFFCSKFFSSISFFSLIPFQSIFYFLHLFFIFLTYFFHLLRRVMTQFSCQKGEKFFFFFCQQLRLLWTTLNRVNKVTFDFTYFIFWWFTILILWLTDDDWKKTVHGPINERGY